MNNNWCCCCCDEEDEELIDALTTLARLAKGTCGLVVQISDVLEDDDGTKYQNVIVLPHCKGDVRVSRIEKGKEVKYSYIQHFDESILDSFESCC